MWLILDHVSRGHRFWTRGTIPASKLERFAMKLHERFGVRVRHSTRARWRAQGRPTAHMVVFPTEHDPQTFYWWLLVAGSEHQVQALAERYREQLRDVEREHLEWSDEYVLKCRQRASEAGGGRAWTWFLARQRYAEVETELVRLAAAHGRSGERTDDLTRAATMLRARPMFGGVRLQAAQALRRAAAVWAKTHGGQLPPDYLTAPLPFFGRRPRIYS